MAKNLPVNTPIVKGQGLPTEDFVFFLNDLMKTTSSSSSDVNTIAGMLFKFNLSKSSAYTIYTYSGTQITQIDVYTDSTKAEQLYKQVITYSSGKITGYTLNDLINSKTLTVVYGYSGTQITTKTMSIT